MSNTSGRLRNVVPFVGMGALFVAVLLLALALVPSFDEAGLQATPDAEDPTFSVLYFGAILVFTAFVLYIVKRGVERVLQAIILLSVAVLSFYTLAAVLNLLLAETVALGTAAVLSLGIAAAVYTYPEWYVIDTAAVLMGAAGAGIFGISFGILPALLFLVVLAVYDAVAVYRTKHMLTLADGVMNLRLPVMFVVPKRADYSFIESAESNISEEDIEGEKDDGDGEDDPEDTDDGEQDDGGRDALFMGVGDAVIPGVLVASAAHFLNVPLFENYAAMGTFVGALAGFVVLMREVSKGEAHAGLPLLNGGAIFGFFVGAYLLGVTPLEVLGL